MTTLIASSSGSELDGSTGNDVLIGKAGADTLDGGGGADILLGGAGSDVIYYDEFDIRADGGTGYDTLIFNGTSQSLNLGLQKTVMNFERIDLAGGGGHTLTFSAADVLRTSDLDMLLINGTQTSHVSFADSGWTFQGFSSGLSKFVNGSAIVYIDIAVDVVGFSGNAEFALAPGSATSVTEDTNPDAFGKLVAAGTVLVTDPNAGQGYLSMQVQAVGSTTGTLSLAAGPAPGTSNGSYVYEISNAAVQGLGATQSHIDAFIVTSVDGKAMTLEFTTYGSNDPAQIGMPASYELTEDVGPDGSGNLVASGSLSITDDDDGQASFDLQGFDGQGSYGTLSLMSDGQYSYTVSNAGVQGLIGGEALSDFFEVRSVDGSTIEIEFIVHGADDAASIGTPTVSSVREDLNVIAGKIKATGVIPIVDADANQQAFDLSGFDGQGTWGVLTLDASGSYTYSVDNAAINDWNGSRTEIDTFTVTTVDGSTADVSFEVRGSNDAPAIISGIFSASFTEDAASLNADGSLPVTIYDTGGNFTFSDVDHPLNSGFGVNVQGLNGAIGVPIASITYFGPTTTPSVIWSVFIDDAQLASLKSGEDLVQTYRITVTDPSGASTTQDATVTIHGADDPIMGDGAGNPLNGTAGNDLMSGLGGNDVINGAAGNDTIYGGAGNDALNGGAGNDTLIADSGNDILSGDDGSDILKASAGIVSGHGGSGDDSFLISNGVTGTLSGDAGADYFQVRGQRPFGSGLKLDGGDGSDSFDFAGQANGDLVWIRDFDGVKTDGLFDTIDLDLPASNYTINKLAGDSLTYFQSVFGSDVTADTYQLSRVTLNSSVTVCLMNIGVPAGDTVDMNYLVSNGLAI